MSLMAVSIGATIAGGLVSAMGAQQAASAQNQAAQFNASVAERNKVIADQDRKQALETARIASEDKARENRRVMSALRTQYGGSGFELAGTPLEVLADTSTEMALDERRIQYEGTVRSREGAVRMLGLQDDANLSRMEGKNALKAGRYAAMGSLLSAAGGAASSKATFDYYRR